MLLTIIGLLGLSLLLGTVMHFFVPIEEYTATGVFRYAVICVAAATALLVVMVIIVYTVWALVTGMGQVLG